MNFTKNPTHVCHITSVHPASDVRIFFKECRSLAQADYNVTLIAPGAKYKWKDGIRIVGIDSSKGGRFSRMTSTIWKIFCAAFRENASLYHIHDPELVGVGMLLKLLRGKKVIYDVHEDYSTQTLYKQYIPKILRRSVAFLIKIVEHLFSRLFDGIITATDDILKNFSHHKRAISVKNFPISSRFTNLKRGKNRESNIFHLIYIGLLAEIRGISHIIKALEFVDYNEQLKLSLYGKFDPPNYAADLKKLEGFNKVNYLGWIDPSDIPKLLENFDVGIVCLHPISNYLTALPTKLFEYMAANLPVIVSNFPLWKEIVEGNKCGICVNPLSPEDIAEAIKYFLKHPETRKMMGNNGRQAVLQKYNWESESEKLINLYTELLKNDY